jgi:redox-sensitive bicupin YhaK (pirin superfamily)
MGDVQIMSAGTGIVHSEYNASNTEPVKFLQIWVFPKRQGLSPRYEQISFDIAGRKNQWQTVVSPDQEGGSIKIFQQAWFKLADIEAGKSLDYALHQKGQGLYLFMLEGEVTIAGETLHRRDAAALEDTNEVSISATADSKLLAIEIPLYQ